jgi:hypothetical protein
MVSSRIDIPSFHRHITQEMCAPIPTSRHTKVTDAARAKYTEHTLTATDHSWGGTLAQDTNATHTNTQIAFSKGTSSHDIIYKLRKA